MITGFSGHIHGRPVLPEAERAAALENPDYLVIDLDGPVVTLTGIEGYGHAMNGDEVTRLADDRLYARQIGQVFGAVIDTDLAPNLYLAASSAYGLQIVGPDLDGDHLADRLTQGGPSATWMDGQWGADPLSGPGTIWRVDGLTGQISIFANLSNDGQPNPGPGLGNLAFDSGHDQLFASDLSSGLIHRLDLRGTVVETYDHGVKGRPAEGLGAAAFKPSDRVEITNPGFDSQDPGSWGLAQDDRRVWGMAVHEGRLYYAVASGVSDRPEVWSIGIDRNSGAFVGDPQWEVALGKDLPEYEISDIGFAPDGAMVLAQRGIRQPKYDFSRAAEVGKAEVVRFVREAPQDDPSTPSVWVAVPQTHAVGFAGHEANTTGGLAFGPAYDERGNLDFSQCRGTLWASGERLRDRPDLALDLSPGGEMQVGGAMALPYFLGGAEGSPPWISYSHDFDGLYSDSPDEGMIGDVAVLGCDGDGDTETTTEVDWPETGCKGKDSDWIRCLRDPKSCEPDPQACAKNDVKLACDPRTGAYVAVITQGPNLFDTIKLADPSDQLASLPMTLPASGEMTVSLDGLSSGQIGQITLCSFDSKVAADGKPHDCCNTTVTVEIPSEICKKEIQ